jgi:hypothetical protein
MKSAEEAAIGATVARGEEAGDGGAKSVADSRSRRGAVNAEKKKAKAALAKEKKVASGADELEAYADVQEGRLLDCTGRQPNLLLHDLRHRKGGEQAHPALTIGQ